MKLWITKTTSVVAIVTLAGILFTPPIIEHVWPYLVVLPVGMLVILRKPLREAFWAAVEILIGDKGWSK